MLVCWPAYCVCVCERAEASGADKHTRAGTGVFGYESTAQKSSALL